MNELLRGLAIIIPNIVINYTVFSFYSQKFVAKRGVATNFVLYLALTFIQSSGVLLFPKSVANIIMYVVLLFLIGYLFFEGKNRYVYISIYLCYIILIDVITVPLASSLRSITASTVFENDWIFFLTGIFTALIALCTHQLLITLMVRKKILLVKIREQIFIIVLSVFEIFIIMATFVSGLQEERHGVSLSLYIGFLVLDFYLVIMFEQISKANEIEKRLLVQDQQKEYWSKYVETIEAQILYYRKMKHDLRHHLRVLEMNVENQDYINKLLQLVEEGDVLALSSSNTLNVILYDARAKCDDKGITLKLQLEKMNLDFVEDVDISVLFANLIENAIEESEQVRDGGFVSVALQERRGYLYVEIRNRCRDSRIFSYVEGKTNKDNHAGLGIRSVMDVIEQYQGTYKYGKVADEFYFRFLIPME